MEDDEKCDSSAAGGFDLHRSRHRSDPHDGDEEDYFHRLSSSAVIGGGVQFPTPSDVSGWGVNAEVRLHPSGKAPRGFYFAPNISYNALESGSEKANPFSIGGLVGWQWFPGEDFAMGLGIGADFYTGSVEDESGDIGKFDGWAPALRFDIGYAW